MGEELVVECNNPVASPGPCDAPRRHYEKRGKIEIEVEEKQVKVWGGLPPSRYLVRVGRDQTPDLCPISSDHEAMPPTVYDTSGVRACEIASHL